MMVFLVRIESEAKAIIRTVYDIPGAPIAVTDTLGNTYTRHGETSEAATWYTIDGLAAAAAQVTFTFADGRTISRYLE